MKQKNGFKLWQILYPIALYYVVSSITYFGLELIFGVTTTENYMVRQLVCGAISIPFILRFYIEDKKARDIVYGAKKFQLDKTQLKHMLLTIVTVGTAGMAVNNLIAMTPLVKASAGFQNANASFFGGDIVFQLLGSCLMIPIAEELLFRGVVYQRIRVYFDVRVALLLSALLFGIVHANFVQFLYATLLGILLAFLYEKTGFFYIPALGHITANTIAVIRTATGWLDFTYEPTVAGIGVTVMLFVAAIGLICYQIKEYNLDTIS